MAGKHIVRRLVLAELKVNPKLNVNRACEYNY